MAVSSLCGFGNETKMENEPVLGGLVICRPAPIYYTNGFEQGYWLMSDLHLGAPQVDEEKIRRELLRARERNDRILINGDVLDLILPKDHKRYSPDALHPRFHGRSDIVNAVIDFATEMLGPYADLIDMVGVGNHETAVSKWHSSDVTLLLVRELYRYLSEKQKKTHIVHYGGFTGYYDARFRFKQNEKLDTNGKRWVLFYHHGHGGESPVTKGMIDFNRLGWVNADCVWLGHKHNRFIDHEEQLVCPLSGDDVIVKDRRHIMTGSYFKTYCGQSQESIHREGRRSNHAADKAMAPRGKGGARIVIRFNDTESTKKPYEIEVTQ